MIEISAENVLGIFARLREEQGITMAQVGRSMGRSKAYVRMLHHGASLASVRAICEYAKVLGWKVVIVPTDGGGM